MGAGMTKGMTVDGTRTERMTVDGIGASGGERGGIVVGTAMTGEIRELNKQQVSQALPRKLRKWCIALDLLSLPIAAKQYPLCPPSVLSHYILCSISQAIQEDMNEWSASGMWVLSCYAYHKDSPCVPGLLDISPEELRYEAYKAKASGNSASYLQNLNQLGTKQMTMQSQLGKISIDDAHSLVR